ncbi:polysaccharide biosynthesis/export family protein [Sphingomonas nostoxanthinifaciens]|uniref:polysaccharide biosynthesis/export family protein n=1 Tax=Sphingomonas nostoxanthinifaciens TaxID=2872652 RepID=UPI001CC205AD|nr:polysaccharide biosynthesis/export family protein [Sphingomonas nostoxanthinifaciens]UAK23395.1 polysaccharide export protein [Sphingomonas nostoxanthinifaciens]
MQRGCWVGSAMVMALALALPACAKTRLETPPPPSAGLANYRLSGGDSLKIAVYGEPTLTDTYQVSNVGIVSLPLVGTIKADGLTVEEFRTALEHALANGYLKDPKVSAEIVNYRPVYVLGEVQKAGQYPYIPGMTLRQAIAAASGYTYRAQMKVIFVTHTGEGIEHAYPLQPGTPVMPGDTVRVAERHF